jgi:hypothetical protein
LIGKRRFASNRVEKLPKTGGLPVSVILIISLRGRAHWLNEANRIWSHALEMATKPAQQGAQGTTPRHRVKAAPPKGKKAWEEQSERPPRAGKICLASLRFR